MSAAPEPTPAETLTEPSEGGEEREGPGERSESPADLATEARESQGGQEPQLCAVPDALDAEVVDAEVLGAVDPEDDAVVLVVL